MNRPGLLAVECRSMHLATPPPPFRHCSQAKIQLTPIADERIHCIHYTVCYMVHFNAESVSTVYIHGFAGARAELHVVQAKQLLIYKKLIFKK